jgi:hypothetical protein
VGSEYKFIGVTNGYAYEFVFLIHYIYLVGAVVTVAPATAQEPFSITNVTK